MLCIPALLGWLGFHASPLAAAEPYAPPVSGSYVTNWYKPRENGSPPASKLTHPVLVTADEVSRIVGVYDPATGDTLAVIPVEGTPHHPYLSKDRRLIFVTQRSGNGIAVIDTRTWTRREIRFPCPPTRPCPSFHVGQSRDGRLAAATIHGMGGAIAILDARNGTLLRIVKGIGNRPRDAVFSKNGRKVYVSLQGEEYLAIYHLRTGTLVKVPRGGTSYKHPSGSGMDISEDGRYLALSNTRDNEVVILDTRTDRIVARAGNVPGPVNVSFLGREGRLLATGNRKTGSVSVLRFDGRRLTLLHTEKTNPGANIVTLGPDGFLWASSNGGQTIRILSPRTYRVRYTIPVVRGPHWIYFSSDGKRAFVTNWGSSYITVVSIPKKAALKSFPVGRSPNGMVLVYLNRPSGFSAKEKSTAEALRMEASHLILPKPRSPEERAFLSSCLRCHGIQRIQMAPLVGTRWDSLVRRMKTNGATIDEKETREIIRYLESGAQKTLDVRTELETKSGRGNAP